jgi:hypothetical protein
MEGTGTEPLLIFLLMEDTGPWTILSPTEGTGTELFLSATKLPALRQVFPPKAGTVLPMGLSAREDIDPGLIASSTLELPLQGLMLILPPMECTASPIVLSPIENTVPGPLLPPTEVPVPRLIFSLTEGTVARTILSPKEGADKELIPLPTELPMPGMTSPS